MTRLQWNKPDAMFADFLHFLLTVPAATPAALPPSLGEAATHTELFRHGHARPSPAHKTW